MDNVDDLYGKKKRKPLLILGVLATLITATAGLLSILSETGLLRTNLAQPQVVVVTGDTSAPAPPPALPTARPATLPPPPTQAAGVTAETEQFVNDFLSGAIAAEILARTYSDASYAALYFTGDPLQSIREAIADLYIQGLYAVPEFDVNQSYIADIRMVRENLLEVDTCEAWSESYYWLIDGSFAASEPPHLVPQTITIERFIEGWFITKIAFYNLPSFC